MKNLKGVALGSALLVCVVIALSSCVNLSSIVVTMPDLTAIEDGSYTGQYTVGPVFAKVSVGVAAGRITSFTILEHRTGKGQAAEVLASRVVEKQTLDLDAVSGATYSSKAILKAGQAALEGGK
jgi:uncharacterized protein with FMN-binding domain